MSSSSNENTQLIEQFYTSFQQHDYKGMIACYHPQVEFSDPVFLTLKGKRASAMWHMLIERGKELTLEFGGIQASNEVGKAHWEAKYPFSGTGRQVHNIIDANFRFQGGKIFRHDDHFDLWRWTRMALGTSGILLGWSPIVQNKVRTTARASLDKFIAQHPEYQS
jgi:ketosteroid isomerase-like protein